MVSLASGRKIGRQCPVKEEDEEIPLAVWNPWEETWGKTGQKGNIFPIVSTGELPMEFTT